MTGSRDTRTKGGTEFTVKQLDKLETYARSLPYEIESNEEAQAMLDLYLVRITQCVTAKDYDPGFLQWDSMLNYWRMLKYPISKSKRIAVVKVYFDLSLTPGMPLHIVNSCVDTLGWLMRSKNKLNIDDMRLPWKPIWHVLSNDLFLSRRQFEITQTTNLMATLAEMSQRFFHPACADEMLDTILPRFNGMDMNSVLSTQYYLNTFLPLSHPTWLPMMMRIWSSVNSYMFDERHLELLASLAEMHLDPSVSDPRRIEDIPDDARIDEEGHQETGPRPRWPREEHAPLNPARMFINDRFRRHEAGIKTINVKPPMTPDGYEAWRGVFKDIGIFTQEEWDFIMCKCLTSMEIPLAESVSFMTGPAVDEQASFEFSRLPKSDWRIYSLARLIVYSMAPDGKQLPKSGSATPFELPVTHSGDYFAIPNQTSEKKYLAGCKALDSLARLIVSLESFFHPNNAGSWTTDLTAFLKNIVYEFGRRWNEESKADCKVPQNRRLTLEIRRELVRSLRTPAFLAMFSSESDTVSNVQSALKSMTIMEPDLIVPPVIERAIPSLEALVETDRTLAVIKALGAIALGLVSRDLYYPGAKHLVQILELLLPGIDLNDPLKTVCTTAFLVEISQHIMFSDLTHVEIAAVSSDMSQASWSPTTSRNDSIPMVHLQVIPDPQEDSYPRLSDDEEDALLRDSSASFANWVTGFIRRVMVLLENLPEEDASGGSTESTVVNSVTEACSQICTHLSEPLFDLVLGLIYDFASTTVRSNAVRAVHQLVDCVGQANPSKTLARFVPFAISNITTELEYGASSIRSTTYSHVQSSDTTLHWNIAILRGTLQHSGQEALKYREEIDGVLRLLHSKCLSKRGFSYTGKLIGTLMSTLTQTYPSENRFVNADEWESRDFQAQHYKTWGRLYVAEDVKVQWHVPNQQEINFALNIFFSIVEPILVTLEGLLAADVKRDSVWSNNFCRHLSFVRNAFNGAPSLLQEFTSDEEIANSCATSDVMEEIPQLIASVRSIKSGFALHSPGDPSYVAMLEFRARFGRFLHSASISLLKQGDESSIDAIIILIRSCRTYLLDYADSRYSYSAQQEDYVQELGVSRRHANQKLWPRAIFVRKARYYHSARMKWNALERKRGELEDHIIDDLARWSTWSYATVRASAQGLLDSATSAYDGIRKRVLPSLWTSLEKGTDDDQMKGALYTLYLASFSKFAMGEPNLVPSMIKPLFQSQWNEKPSIQECVSSVIENCITGFVEPCHLVYELEWQPTGKSVDFLSSLLPGHLLDDSLIKQGETNRKVRIVKQLEAMVDMRRSLLDVVNQEDTHWRYSIGALRLLRTLIRRDGDADADHLKFIVSQTFADHPSLRYYAQRAVMKSFRYIKLRTSTRRPEDLARYRNRNPLRRGINTTNPSHEYTAVYLESFGLPVNHHEAQIEPLLEDKPYSGWLVWSQERRYLYPAEDKSTFQPWSSGNAVEAVRKAITDETYWEKLSVFYSEENHNETLVVDNVACVKSIVQLLEEDCLTRIKPVVATLIADTDQDKQRGAAEIIAGVIGGSKHWSAAAQRRLWDWLQPVLELSLSSKVKTDTLPIWSSFLEYILANRDPRRLYPLVDWLMQQALSVDFNAESSFEPIKLTFFIRTVIESLGWRFTTWAPTFWAVYWKAIGSEHDEVTSYISEALASFCKIHWRPTPSKPVAQIFVRECATRLASDDIMGCQHGYQIEDLNELVSNLPRLRQERLSGANAPRSPYDRMFMTVIRWVFGGLQEVNAASMFQYIIPILPELFHAAELQDSDDLARRSHVLLVTICGVTPPPGAIPKFLEILFHTIKKSPSWRIRSSVLPIMQILYFRQVPLIAEETVIQMQDILTECLMDEVVEVREKAAITLSGILRCSPRRTILILKERFVRKAASTILPPRKAPTYATKLRELHAAVLGVTALIEAFPYSIPSWLPGLIGDVLSRHTYDPIPISTSVRKCAIKFKETHQDTWHEDSIKFNEDQLSALATLLAGSSYYA